MKIPGINKDYFVTTALLVSTMAFLGISIVIAKRAGIKTTTDDVGHTVQKGSDTGTSRAKLLVVKIKSVPSKELQTKETKSISKAEKKDLFISSQEEVKDHSKFERKKGIPSSTNGFVLQFYIDRGAEDKLLLYARSRTEQPIGWKQVSFQADGTIYRFSGEKVYRTVMKDGTYVEHSPILIAGGGLFSLAHIQSAKEVRVEFRGEESYHAFMLREDVKNHLGIILAEYNNP